MTTPETYYTVSQSIHNQLVEKTCGQLFHTNWTGRGGAMTPPDEGNLP